MSAPVLEWQILARDAGAVGKFYGQLFHWVVDADNPLGYGRVTSDGGGGFSGGIWPAPEAERNFVQLFIGVDDVKEYFERAQGLGATPIVPPRELPDGDQLAIMLDPFGMAFGIIRKG